MSIIQRIHDGDVRAFDNLYLKNKVPFISWFTHNCLIDKEKAKDLYHETCIMFYNNIMSDKVPADFPDYAIKKYLNSTGKFLLLNELRRGVIKQKRQMLSAEEIEKNLAAGRPFLAGWDEIKKYETIKIGPVSVADIGAVLPDIIDEGIDEEAEDKHRIVRECVNNMPMPCSRLLDLTVYQRKSYSEVARIMEYGSADVAKTQRSRCFNRLRAIVKEQFRIRGYEYR